MSLQQLIDQSIPFVQRSGLQVLDCGPGFAECRMPLSGNANHVGTLYAGAQFTLADITGGVLILEVGHNRRRLERIFPRTPFLWPYTSGGDDCVAIIGREDLVNSLPADSARARSR